MRAIIFLVIALIAMVMSVAAGATDEKTIIITGTKVVMDNPVDLSFDGITIMGFVEGGNGSYFVQKRTELRFFPAANEVRLYRLKRSRGIFGQVCLLGGDDSSIEMLREVSTLRLGPGEFAEVTWRIPEPQKEAQPAKRHRRTRTDQQSDEQLAKIPDGTSLYLDYSGDFATGPVPIIDPRYPVRCRMGKSNFSAYMIEWENWGKEREESSGTKGVTQPTCPLGYAGENEWLTLWIESIPPAGELTLYPLSGGVAIFQSGYCPRMEMRVMKDPKRHTAIAVCQDDEWTWQLEK